MQTFRVVLVWLVVGASIVGFATWVTMRSPERSADSAPPLSAEGAADAVAAEEQRGVQAAQAELAHVQEKLAAAIKTKRSPAAVLADARALVERHPEFSPGYVTLGQILSVSGQGAKAYVELEKALALNPKQPEVHDLAGSLALGLKEYAQAQQHYSTAAGLEPRTAKYRLHLAVVQLKADRFEDARNTLLQALKLDSDSHQAYGVLSDLYAQQNKLDQALDAINRALELLLDDPAYRQSYLRRKATLLRRANRPEEAIVVLRQLPPKTWVERGVIDEFAQTYMLLGQPEKAAEHYEAVLPLDPLADWAAERAAHYRLEAGQKDRAREDLEALRRINPRAAAIPRIEAALRE